MPKMQKQTRKPLPFKREFHEPVTSHYSSTKSISAYVPKGEISFLIYMYRANNDLRSNNFRILGNPFLRDLAEDFPSQFDNDSMLVKHEGTHSRTNYKQYDNITESLTERVHKNYNSKNRQKRTRPDHSLDRKNAKPLGKSRSVNSSAGKMENTAGIKQESKIDQNELNKQKAKKILEESKEELKPAIKIEMPDSNLGFKLEDFVKGNFWGKAGHDRGQENIVRILLSF